MKIYETVFDQTFKDFGLNTDIWNICQANPNGLWDRNAGGIPKVVTENGESFLRLDAVKVGDTYQTAAIKSKQRYGDGRWTVIAKFKGGNGTWPAIWMNHRENIPDSDKKNFYEIDICEYFQKRFWCKTGIFHAASMKHWWHKLFRPKRHPFIKRNKWNKFVCEWNQDEIKIIINDKKVIRFKNNGNEDFFPTKPEFRQFDFIISMQYYKPWLLPIKLSQLPLYIDVKEIKYEKLINNA